MAGDLRGFVLEKAEFISRRLKELLSSGEGYVQAHFGLDLGLKADQFPPWVILFTAAAGLLMLAVSCTAVCGALLGGKKRRSLATASQGNTEPDKASLNKNTAKSEELKKKTKKKLNEKKNPSNGQPVSISQEDFQENEKLSPKVKAEKVYEVQTTVQMKKNKKKPKLDVKPTQHVSTAEGKEQDEGAWETKVSNREKRQLRKKERGPDDSGSPGGVETLKAPAEGPGAKTTKRNKNHDHQFSKSSGKGDSTGAVSSWSEESMKNSAGWTDISLKMSTQMGSVDGPKWSGIPAAQPWTQETQAAWSGIESRMKNDLNSVSFSMLGLSTTEPPANPIEQWTNQQDPEDEWSGFNGMTAADPSSDWNAPVEHWGNYEEPPAVEASVFPLKEQSVKLSGDEKESEDPSDAVKAKKRRRKKKKTEEETASQTVSSVSKHQELPGQPSHKPCISSAQKKPEEMADPLKHTQKKKVRRDT